MSKFLKGYLMLKILNNDKFTTAQNRHFLVSLKIPILNTLPFRAFLFALCSFIMCACFAAYDLAQNPENLYVFDQLAYRLWHRYMGRCANIRRRSEAKHCSSLCSQSEGDEYCGGQTRLKIQRRYALKRWLYSLRVRGPHFASKVSYNAGAATDDYAGQCKSRSEGAVANI